MTQTISMGRLYACLQKYNITNSTSMLQNLLNYSTKKLNIFRAFVPSPVGFLTAYAIKNMACSRSAAVRKIIENLTLKTVFASVETLFVPVQNLPSQLHFCFLCNLLSAALLNLQIPLRIKRGILYNNFLEDFYEWDNRVCSKYQHSSTWFTPQLFV